MLQTFPRNATVTSISAQFSNRVALSLVGSSVTLTAQLYVGSSGSNIASAVPGASCTLSPTLTGLVAIGATGTCLSTGLSVPVSAGSVGFMMISGNTPGLQPLTPITGMFATSVAAS